MKNSLRPLFLLLLGVWLSAFLYAGNSKRKIIVNGSQGVSIEPGSERVPPRTFCPFDLYYDQDIGEVEIQVVDEVDYLSYSIETSDGILIESDSLGVTPEGTSLYVSFGAYISSQYEIQLSCNYGVYYATFALEYEE